jgi:hypothetical protein
LDNQTGTATDYRHETSGCPRLYSPNYSKKTWKGTMKYNYVLTMSWMTSFLILGCEPATQIQLSILDAQIHEPIDNCWVNLARSKKDFLGIIVSTDVFHLGVTDKDGRIVVSNLKNGDILDIYNDNYYDARAQIFWDHANAVSPVPERNRTWPEEYFRRAYFDYADVKRVPYVGNRLLFTMDPKVP